jgi:hypothetical protein
MESEPFLWTSVLRAPVKRISSSSHEVMQSTIKISAREKDLKEEKETFLALRNFTKKFRTTYKPWAL